MVGTYHNRYIYRIHTDSEHIQKQIDLSAYISHIQSYTCSEVPVGTIGLILILQNLTYFTDTTVPMGTTELILILLIREYPWVLQNLYLFY